LETEMPISNTCRQPTLWLARSPAGSPVDITGHPLGSPTPQRVFQHLARDQNECTAPHDDTPG